jgi:pyruvate dehydrogenase E2 component (dihydrolipoamide acetyltransferase)
MAFEVVMPQLGLTMTEGTVVNWIKKVGDHVKRGDALFEVETDKVVQEVPSVDEGLLSSVLVEEGKAVPIGTVIAYLTAPGEKAPGEGAAAPVEAAAAPVAASTAVAAPVEAAVATAAVLVRASPAAKKLAAKLGVDINLVHGSGPGGRIVEADIQKAAAAATIPVAVAPVAVPTPVSQPSTPVVGERIELKGARKVAAERMALSFSTVPHFYLTVEVEAGSMVALREQIKAAVEKRFGVTPTITDMLIKALSIALIEQPDVNASWANGAIVRNPRVNLGVAASIDSGLVVPVILGVDGLSLGGIVQRRKALVEKARANRLTLTDLEGGTFTLSNLGMFGIDQFQAIVNPPQAAILAVGRIKERVGLVDGQVKARPTMFMTLSVDHRVLDGAAGAKFMARVVELLENPVELMIGE